ncbi:Endo-1,4-beta-xylanase A precursor [compost metagenome]
MLLKASEQMKDAKMIIQAGDLSYELKLGSLNLKKLVGQMQLPAEEIMIYVQFGNVPKEQEEQLNALLRGKGIDPLIKPVYYELAASAKGVMLHSEQVDHIYQEQILILPFKADRSELTAIKIDSDTGKIQFAPALFQPMSNDSTMVILKRSGNGVYTVIRSDLELSDITRHWAKAEIELLTSKLIVQGNHQGRFEPNKPVTRAEFVAMLVRALGLDGPRETGTFADIDPASWYSDDVELAVKLGLVQGFENQTFRPYSLITRQEMAVMAARAWTSVEQVRPKPAEGSILTRFTDEDSLSEWSRDAISLLVQQNIMQGIPGSRFAPDSSASRAEAAVILTRLLQNIQYLDEIE